MPKFTHWQAGINVRRDVAAAVWGSSSAQGQGEDHHPPFSSGTEDSLNLGRSDKLTCLDPAQLLQHKHVVGVAQEELGMFLPVWQCDLPKQGSVWW